MRTLFAVALASAAFVATPALAQDAADAPFTGPHIEALVGYDRVNAGEDFDSGDDGVLYGVGLGYDFQLGGAILGVEGEISGSNTKSRTTGLFAAGDRYTVRAGRDLYVGARLGFAVAPSTMLYAKAGYTNAGSNVYYTPAGGTTANSTLEADGYRLGAGVEQKFNLFGPSGFVKAEYRYSNYSKLNSTVSANSVDIDTDRHQAVVGIGVRF